MDTRGKIELCLRLWDKIHFFWHWYVGGLLILIGWALGTDREWDNLFKGVITVMFVAFVVMNVSGLSRSYRLMGAARKDLQNTLTGVEDNPELRDALISLTFPCLLLKLVYGTGIVAGLFAIWIK